MNYSRTLNAVCFGDLKQAALYFERVIPVCFRSMIAFGAWPDIIYLNVPEEIPGKTFVSLVFGPGPGATEWQCSTFLEKYGPFREAVEKYLTNCPPSADPEVYETELKHLYLTNHSKPGLGAIRNEFFKFAANLGCEYSTVLLPSEEVTQDFEQAYVTVTLSGLPLIDPGHASWEQIMEIRRDPESVEKLRRLRLFVFENYTGKPRAFIEDDLFRRVDDYERVRKSLGIEAVTSTISVLLDSKTLQASAAAGLIACLFGGPPNLILGAASLVELGKLGIEAARKRQSIRDFEQGHELGYIISAVRRIQGK